MGLVQNSITSYESYTPRNFWKVLDDEFHFGLDVAATYDSTVCEEYFTIEDDGLNQDWSGFGGSVWCNPPFSRSIGRWVEKSYEESLKGTVVVMLIPVKSDTMYWHRYVMRAAEVRLVKGRLSFGGSTSNAPFPCAVVLFDKRRSGPVFSSIDRVID